MNFEQTNTHVRKALEAASIEPAGATRKAYRAEADQPLARYFDHTLLKPEAGSGAFETLFREAVDYEVASVCVPPNRVEAAVSALSGSPVMVCTVIGFPLGYDTTESKRRTVEVCDAAGCDEFDTVIPIGFLKDGDYAAVYTDIRGVVEAAGDKLVKVIIETALLTDDEKAAASLLTVLAGAGMIKTSTGFADAGAALSDIRLMRDVAPETVGIKAAGGIRDLEFARRCVEAGADRLGASKTVQILSEES